MPTAHASGAWREDELHLAPVAGLVIHHMERWRQENIDPSLTFSRFSMDILGQIGREEIQLSTEVLRPGRTIELIETTAVIAGRATIRARAWLLQNGDTSSVVGEEFDALPRFEECEDVTGELGWPGGFIASVKAAQAPGRRPGRNKIWITSELPLVEGEEAQPLAEFCKLLDTANGVAVRQKPEEWMYPNVDLTFHIFREPQGIQMGLDTRVAFGANGIGLTSSVVHDAEGPVGTLNQSLTLRKL
ncbi:thioesterase family protein [Corynebacterium lubricantis]|uniref:thioesterase family protein n=1 Tax=Corynebacterium lubricantis TaxID=541095 RepID=UPI00247FD75D|nr:thioesterase family protein [Corynebacterium lubricantis]